MYIYIHTFICVAGDITSGDVVLGYRRVGDKVVREDVVFVISRDSEYAYLGIIQLFYVPGSAAPPFSVSTWQKPVFRPPSLNSLLDS